LKHWGKFDKNILRIFPRGISHRCGIDTARKERNKNNKSNNFFS
jgi:hypothetical protein